MTAKADLKCLACLGQLKNLLYQSILVTCQFVNQKYQKYYRFSAKTSVLIMLFRGQSKATAQHVRLQELEICRSFPSRIRLGFEVPISSQHLNTSVLLER